MHKVSLLYITTSPVLLHSPENPISTLKQMTDKTKMRMLRRQESLAIHCLCIKYFTGSFLEWENSQKSNTIM